MLNDFPDLSKKKNVIICDNHNGKKFEAKAEKYLSDKIKGFTHYLNKGRATAHTCRRTDSLKPVEKKSKAKGRKGQALSV